MLGEEHEEGAYKDGVDRSVLALSTVVLHLPAFALVAPHSHALPLASRSRLSPFANPSHATSVIIIASSYIRHIYAIFPFPRSTTTAATDEDFVGVTIGEQGRGTLGKDRIL